MRSVMISRSYWAKVIRILQRRNTTVSGTLRRSYNFWHIVPDDPHFFYDVIVADPQKSAVFPTPQEDDKVLVRLNEWTQRHINPSGEIIENFGKSHTPMSEYKAILSKYKLEETFPAGVLAEVEKIPQTVGSKDMRGRFDARGMFTITIDPEDARDFDDALSLSSDGRGGWVVGVHIADVSYYVRPNSAIDREALKRGNSTYLTGTVIPMLPEALSNGICSLNPNVDRLTMVCDALIDAEGKTTAYQFYPAVIRSHARLTYTQVWSALSGEDAGFEALGERLFEVERLYELYKVLHAAREKRFALDFESSEIKALINEEKGTIDRFEPYRITDANRLIEECMLVANVAAADFVLRNEKLTLFRVHDKPEEERLQDLRRILRAYKLKLSENSPAGFAALLESVKKSPSTSPLQIAVLRTMSRALYSPDNIGHYGLQYEHYAHFTSPIRRYPDLLLHRTI